MSSAQIIPIDVDQLEMSDDSNEWVIHPEGCYSCPIVIVSENEGGFSVFSKDLPGVVSHGENRVEAISNIREALCGAITEYVETNTPIPWDDSACNDPGEEIRITINV